MGLSETISILIKADGADVAAGKVHGFRGAMAEADGAGGKFKAGMGSAFTSVKEHAGALAIGGGAAILAFGVKAVNAFVDTAKAALDLGTATGLTTEQASKWIAVADDFGIGAGDVQGALGKISKTLDDTKWAEYGIATRDAGGQARSVNDIFLDSLDKLGKITNETERAKAGNDLFGKGYSNIAPMIGKARGEYEGMLDAVSDGQVITNKEAEKAEKMRLAQDALADAFKDIQLAVGEMVAAVAPQLEAFAKGVSYLAEVVGKFQATGFTKSIADAGVLAEETKRLGINTDGLLESTMAAGGGMEEFAVALQGLIDRHREQVTAIVAAAEAHRELTKEEKDDADAARDAGDAHQGLAKDVRDDRDAMQEATAATRKFDDALAGLFGKLDAEEAFDEFQVKMWEYRSAVDPSNEATRDYTRHLGEMVAGLEGVPAETKAKLIAELDDGKLAVVENYLTEWGKGIDVDVRFNPRDYTGGRRTGENARGTTSWRGGPTSINEEGPEIVDLPQGAVIHSASESKLMRNNAGGRTTIVNNFPPGVSPRQVAAAQREWARRNAR